ncbi:hypothetical protein ARMGADRAFT_1080635 [Armillaria gallica]|uniref:Uncharacterized protein n=1 Tax=Armillaria gallica TaxID=47427 RepID=A0A2H3DEN8_ARMGA|nr:hypothetical protein ARMGADRAFT_1080635 [Armillaria gallica]
MNPDLTNEQVTALGITLAAITTTVTASLLTLVYSQELRTFLTQLGVLPPVQCFQRYVRNEPGPRLGPPGPTEPEPTPDAARHALMSLQALYAQNSRIYPSITQYLQNDAIILLTHSIIPRIFTV